MPNTNDPLHTTDHEPIALPHLAVTGEFTPGSSTVDVATGAFVPGQVAEPKGAVLERGPASVSVPGYEIEGVLGRGGMGIVYRARQVRANRLVALKMIRSADLADENERERFRKEAEAIASLDHPNIVTIYDVGSYLGHDYFALEFCPGGNLSGKLGGTPLRSQDAALLAEKLARGMAAAHAAGTVHRDLKPANVLMDAHGEPKITDFGLAKRLDSDDGQTRTGAIMGTPSYMAPEQASGRSSEAGPSADIYSLGAILYEMLTGRPPFRGTTVLETLEQVRSQEPVPAGAAPARDATRPGNNLFEVFAQTAGRPIPHNR